MKYGRVSPAGGVEYSDKLQTTGKVGAEGRYTNAALPGVATVGEALDALVGGEDELYNEVYYGPLSLGGGGGIYICLGIGTLELILPASAGRGITIDVVGESCLFSLVSSESIQIGNMITSPGGRVNSMELGCSVQLMRTASRWVCRSLFGNVEIQEDI